MVTDKIVIAGGGTAGWMAANLFKHHWPQSQVCLIESPRIGSIGVGEGSTPYLKQFFATLGITDAEWMPACKATYKSGITFANWSERAGYKQYFHPFFSPLDIKPGDPFFHNAGLQRQGLAADAHPDHYFVNTQIAAQHRAPVAKRKLPFDLDYGYHFDATLLGQFLHEHAIKLGVEHIKGEIVAVEQDAAGNIKQLVCAHCDPIEGELFIDCTGFSSKLINETLGVKFESYSHQLFNDAAVAIQTPLNKDAPLASCTTSTALSNGWAWHIPLTDRIGNGYVYSSAYISTEQAEQELREHIGLNENADVKVKHLKMKVGRNQQHWHRNCLAAGLSQGFIEPLEATALMLVQYTLDLFIQQYTPNPTEQAEQQNSFNTRINSMFDGIRDYIVTHYKINNRSDSQYWLDCQANQNLPASFKDLLDCWDHNGDFEAALARQKDQLVYLRASWYVILAGMGRYPAHLQEPDPGQVAPSAQSSQYCKDLVADMFPMHRDYLNAFSSSRSASLNTGHS